MDRDMIDIVSLLYKYFEMPPENMYRLLLSVIPPGRKWTPWIKNKRDKKSKTLLNIIADKFKVSTNEAYQYIEIFEKYESGTDQLRLICGEYGMDEKDIDKVMSGPDKDDE